MNFIPVWLGNLTGGAVFVALAYWAVYLKDGKPEAKTQLTEVPAYIPNKAGSQTSEMTQKRA